jgi:hypothetical protein
MAVLTVSTLSRAGLVTSGGAAAGAGGDTFTNDGQTVLLVVNGSGSSINITLAIAQLVDGQTPASRVVAVAAGASTLIGPFPRAVYNAADGTMPIAYSAVTTVTVKVFSVPAS